MKQLRSPGRLVRMWHRREKTAIDHLVQVTGDAEVAAGTTHSAFTSTGLSVEEQVRKVCHPSPGGLAIF